MTDKLSRRDFIKLAALGVAASRLPVVPESDISPSFINGLKVCKEIVTAELSKDPDRIIQARKLALVWVFAETASSYGKEAGIEDAGRTIQHYLYGSGKDL